MLSYISNEESRDLLPYGQKVFLLSIKKGLGGK